MILAWVLCLLGCLVLPRVSGLEPLRTAPPPDNPFHSTGSKHKTGGLALTMTGILVSWSAMGTPSPWRAVPLFLGGLCLVGHLDDRHPLTPGWKIVLQVPLALFLVLSIPRSDWVHQGFSWVILQVAWIVIMTNAYNIIDVADGLLASLAIPLLSVMGGVLMLSGNPHVGFVAFSFAGATLGFLLFNAAPGRQMLGDTGSLPLGGLLSVLALLFPGADSPALGVGSAILMTAVVLFEVAWVSVRRLSLGIPPWRGSPHHFVYWILTRGVKAGLAVPLLAVVQLMLIVPVAVMTQTTQWLIPPLVGLSILLVKPLIQRGQPRDEGNGV